MNVKQQIVLGKSNKKKYKLKMLNINCICIDKYVSIGFSIDTYSQKENFEVLETIRDFQIENFYIKLIPLNLKDCLDKSYDDSEICNSSILIKIYMDGEFIKSILFKSSDIEQINICKNNSKYKIIIFLSGSWFFLV